MATKNESPFVTVKRLGSRAKSNIIEKYFQVTWQQLSREVLPFIVLGLFFLVLFVVYSGRRSLWDDESFSVDLAFSPWKIWWSYIWGVESNMSLYYFFLRVWLWLMTAFGIHATEPVVRFPSAVFAMISVIVVFAMGRKYINPLAGWVAAILFGFSQTTLYYAEEARAYTLYTCAVLFGYYFLFAALHEGADNFRKSLFLWSGFTVAMAIAINAHLIGITFLAAQLVLYLALLLLPNNWQQEARRQIQWIVGSLVGVLILSLPILVDAKIHGGSNVTIPFAYKQDFIVMYRTLALGYNQLSTNILYLDALLGVIGVLLLGLRTYRHSLYPLEPTSPLLDRIPRFSGVTIGLISWFTLPSVFAFLLSRAPFNQHLFLYRYQMAAFVAAFLGAGLIFAIIPWNNVRIALLILVLLLAGESWKEYNAVNVVSGYTSLTAYVGFQRSLNWVENMYHPDDGVLCVAGTLSCADIVTYYFDYAWPDRPARFDSASPGGYAGRPSGPFNPIDPQSIARYAGQHPRMFVITNVDDFPYLTPGLLAVREAYITQHYKLLDDYHTSTIFVQLYQTQP